MTSDSALSLPELYIAWILYSCNEYLYGTKELFLDYNILTIKLMDNIIFHTQYIKMEIRSLHKGVTQSFHYRAIFYLFYHKNGLFRIQFTFHIRYQRNEVETQWRFEEEVFFKMLFIQTIDI